MDCFLFFDYKQIEPRLLAYYLAITPGIEDTRLADYIVSGVDPYTAIVRGIFKKDQLTEEERTQGKIGFLSLMYGGTWKTVAKSQNLSRKDAQQFVDDFHEAWPSVPLLQEALLRKAKSRGYIIGLFGRHLHVEFDHKVVNQLIQNGAADLMRNSLVRVHEQLEQDRLTSHLVNVVHDEMILDCVKDELPYLTATIPRLMDYESVSKVVPIGVDIEYSETTWADKEEYH